MAKEKLPNTFKLDFKVTLIGWRHLERSDALGRVQHSRVNPRISIFFDRVAIFLWKCMVEFDGRTPSEDEFIRSLIWQMISLEVHELTHALLPTSKEEYCDRAEDLARRG